MRKTAEYGNKIYHKTYFLQFSTLMKYRNIYTYIYKQYINAVSLLRYSSYIMIEYTPLNALTL